MRAPHSSSWSVSRVRTFQECRRKYFYRYHLAPAGRRPHALPEACEAERVKDLVGLEAWAGDLVHRLIQQALNRWRGGRLYSEAEAVAEAGQLLSRQFRESREYWSAPADAYPTRPVLLDLHYLGDGHLPKEQARRLKERVTASLRAFFRSSLADRIRAVGPSRWLPIERHAAAHLETDLLVLVKPDFAYLEGETLHILDWKTGRPEPFWEVVQLTCYALYAQEKWKHPLPLIAPQIVHLYPEFAPSNAEFSPESVRDVQGFIRESQAEIRTLVGSEELPPVERFPPAEDGRSCRWCQFRGLCDGVKSG